MITLKKTIARNYVTQSLPEITFLTISNLGKAAGRITAGNHLAGQYTVGKKLSQFLKGSSR